VVLFNFILLLPKPKVIVPGFFLILLEIFPIQIGDRVREQDRYGITGQTIPEDDLSGEVGRIDAFVPEIVTGIEENMGIAVVIGFAFIQLVSFEMEPGMKSEPGEVVRFLCVGNRNAQQE
jgi:hypothetical protein